MPREATGAGSGRLGRGHVWGPLLYLRHTDLILTGRRTHCKAGVPCVQHEPLPAVRSSLKSGFCRSSWMHGLKGLSADFLSWGRERTATFPTPRAEVRGWPRDPGRGTPAARPPGHQEGNSPCPSPAPGRADAHLLLLRQALPGEPPLPPAEAVRGPQLQARVLLGLPPHGVALRPRQACRARQRPQEQGVRQRPEGGRGAAVQRLQREPARGARQPAGRPRPRAAGETGRGPVAAVRFY